MLLQLVRRFHISLHCRAIESSLLAKLRKKTGYTIANCKKALEMHSNDPDKAESWLNEQAQSMGWAKATKLAGRDAAQGLVAVKFDQHHAALVEINCETDFVARNEKFLQMIEDAANACYKFAHTKLDAKAPVTKMCLDAERLSALPSEDNKTLNEKLVLMIGSVGENAVLRRAECWKTSQSDVKLVGYAHPSTSHKEGYVSGKYGAILAYKQTGSDQEIGRKLCQHIVGLNPRKIGNPEHDKPSENSDDETCLIYQEFILDPSVVVKEILEENGVEVIDFVRFSCGESSNVNFGVVQEPLETVQTLQ